MNFSDKCYGKLSMVLTKFFLQVTLQKCVSNLDFSENREQFMDSAVALNETKRDVCNLLQHFRNTVYFFHSANSLTLITVCMKNLISR